METYLPTPLDNLHALMYAADRIKEEKCNDPTIQAKYGNALEWKTNNVNRFYPCPTGTCDSGHCHITSKDICLSQGQLPWDSTGKTLKQCPTGPHGPITGPNCAYKPYLEWNTRSPTGICQMGNFPLRRWCEFPYSRRKKGGSWEKGVTDVPPFIYDPSKSICNATGAYCDWMDVSFHPEYDYANNVFPTCYLRGFQKFMEKWVLGKTIFRNLKKFKPPAPAPHPGSTESWQPETKEEYPDVIRLCDEKYMKTMKNIGPDFAGKGVNLYAITWKDDAFRLDPTLKEGSAGFISSEMSGVYPQLMSTRRNNNRKGKFYTITIKHCRDKNLKRIYLTSFSSSWILNNISTLLKKLNK